MDAILEQFLSEARENLAYLDKNLPLLADGDPQTLDALFRAVHTLKGGAGLVGLDAVKNIVHHAEDLLDGIKKGSISFDENMLDVLYDAFDEVIEMIDATEELGNIPDFDEQKVAEIATEVKNLISKDEASEEEELQTELNIVITDEAIGELVNSYDIASFVKELPVQKPAFSQSFLEDDNFYLLDFDLDEEVCEFGNDPIYMLYLIGEENVRSVLTMLYNKSCKSEPRLYKTRLGVVVKANDELLTDAIYNIIDDVAVYPLSVNALLISNYESIANEIYDDFAKEFNKIIKKEKYDKLAEKLSAVTKVLNPTSKEGFTLTRLELILPFFEFKSKEYIELIKFTQECLGLAQREKKETQNSVQELEENSLDDAQIQTAINALKQQLQVLKHSNDKATLIRVKQHSMSVLGFVGIDAEFTQNDKNEIEKGLQHYISQLSDNDTVESQNEIEPKSEEKAELKAETNLETAAEKHLQEKPKESASKAKASEIKEIVTHKTAIPKTVKIDQIDIDSMMDIIGELLVMKNALPYIANNIVNKTPTAAKSELMGKYEEINRTTEQLQDIIMGMRLLPISYIFNRYPKLIRDTSKKLGKKIEFEEYGGDTKLDKMMIEKIADPLVHIIRNSLDHGIEATPQDRIDAGKSEHGHIKVGAKSEGDSVIIIIEDDGRGIDTQKVLLKALELGIATEEQIESMSEQEKLMMIFNPGLSTAEKITDISGRGVGTDAVMKTISELNGKIELESKSGEGTKTTITLPVSVALTNVFCVKMDSNNYAIAMDYIIETIKIASKDMQIANNKPYARLRGEIIPLIFEPRLLGEDYQDKEFYSIVVIQTNSIRFGLVVDEFVNQLNVVQKPLDGAVANHPLISGTSLLGNGEILFILNANAFVDA